MHQVKFQSCWIVVGLTSNFDIPFAQLRNGSGVVDQEKKQQYPGDKMLSEGNWAV